MAGAWLDAGLPRIPNRSALSRSRPDYRVTFQPEEGPVIRRPGTTARRRRLQATYEMTGAELAALDDFYTANESVKFLFPNPFWRPDSGDPDEVYAEFETPPQEVPIHNDLFRVSLTLLLVE